MPTEAMQDRKQQRRERQHAAVRDEIKAMARSHMARDGAAALSLRAVATALGLSSAAIYYYFPNRDALITALIVDAYRALGAWVRAADVAGAPLHGRLEAAMLAYRDWAIAHPAEYALLFGTPIPGYVGPPEVTAPQARAALAAFGELFALAHEQGALAAPTEAVPPRIVAHASGRAAAQPEPPLPMLLATMRAWGMAHGLVGLELDHHLQPIVGDAAALYAFEMRRLLRELGVRP